MSYADQARILAFGALALVASSYACGQSSADDSENNSSESAFVGFKGSVDNAGVVEMGTILLTTASNPLVDSTLDAFNQEDPFALAQTAAPGYHTAVATNLTKFDALDGKTDSTAAQSSKWIARLASNYQVLDTSKPCGAFGDQHTYLDVERAMLAGTDHTTCGGRMPNEDVLDVTFNFLARGPSALATDADAIGDGIDQATQLATDEFPYLADINE